MSDEPKIADEGILGRGRRLAQRFLDYLRSDETKAKVEQARRKAVEAGKAASVGAKEVVEKAVRAAAQVKDRADELSKSEQAQIVRSKAKEGWDEIWAGRFRGGCLAESRLVVVLSLLLFFPLGLFLLYKHPTLGRNRAWWVIGMGWAILVAWAVISGWVMALYATTLVLLLTSVAVSLVVERRFENPQDRLVWYILMLPPVGLYLLWRDPVRRSSRAWWIGGGIWALIVCIGIADRANKSGSPLDTDSPILTQSVTGGSGPEATQNGNEAAGTFDFSETDYTEGPNGEVLERKEYDTIENVADVGEEPSRFPRAIWYTETGYRNGSGEFLKHGLQAGFYDEARTRKFCERYWVGGVEHGIWNDWHGDGSPRHRLTYVNGKAEGPYIWWFPSGGWFEQGWLKNGELEGEIKGWHRNGRLAFIRHYSKGKKHGKQVVWHENGAKSFEGGYTSGVRQGKYLFWNPDGTPLVEENWVDGKLDGVVVDWKGDSRYETRFDHGRVVFVPGRSTVRAFLSEMEETAIDTRGAGGGFYVFSSQDRFLRTFGEPNAGLVPRGIEPDIKFEWLYRCTNGVVTMKVCNGLSFFVEGTRATDQ